MTKKTDLYYIHASLINKKELKEFDFLLICDSFLRVADAGLTCAGAGVGRVRVQLVRGGAGAGTEKKLMCGFSQARGPAGRVRA